MLKNASSTFRKYLKDPVQSALSSLNDSFAQEQEAPARTHALLTLIAAVIWADGTATDSEIEEYKSHLSLEYSDKEIEAFTSIINDREGIDLDYACNELKDISADKKDDLTLTLYAIAYADNDFADEEDETIQQIAKHLLIQPNHVAELHETFKKEHALREKVLKSGSGIFAALAILFIFGLTATFLKSVLFGVILAYLFMPVQSFFEHSILPSKAGRTLLYVIKLPTIPFKWTATRIRDFFCRAQTGEQPKEENKNKEIACHLTLIFALCTLVLGIVGVTWISAYKASGAGSSIQNWLNTNVGTEQLEELKPKLDSIPGFTAIKDELTLYLGNKENQKKLALVFVDKSGGVLSTVSKILSSLSAFILDALLALFFFSFFLQKMALFKTSGSNWNAGEYVVESIFSTSWMPHTSRETKKEAQLILNSIVDKLRIWIKGYAAIIAIESAIYITIFLILGLPYAVPLGFVAGCTVLLPFIGPLASGSLTVLVYLAATGASSSMTIIVLIMCVYCIMNAVIEQLMLYPALIGEALGLTTLETIIVVLLGGLFAGLAGMIFAVPVASILKLLTPKIYQCMRA